MNRPQLTAEVLEERTMLAAGALDPTFGYGGLVTTDFEGSNSDSARNIVARQADGKIVVVGSTEHAVGSGADFALARYNADGSLDVTFSGDGRVTTRFGGSDTDAFGVALQPDGKIVVAGYSIQGGTSYDFALARFNTDGSLDTTFDNDGKVTTDLGGSVDIAYGVLIQTDGKIVLAGTSNQGGTTYADFALVRYNANGSLDTTFDSDGKVTTDLGSSSDIAYGVALQADGKIVLAGVSYPGGTASDFALVRYNADGSLDSTFSGDGKVTTDFAGSDEAATGVVLQADGKIVLAGYSWQGGTSYDFALARYNADGSVDTTFDTDGRVTTDFGGLHDDIANGVALQANGKIVLAGHSLQGSTGLDFALARYNTDGSLDTAFDGDGRVTTDLESSNDFARGVTLQGDGKIVLAGGSYQGLTSYDFALARYNTDGGLDTTFDTDGKVTTDFADSPGIDRAADLVAIQADGKIVVAGYSYHFDSGYDFGLARYNPDGSLDTTFDGDGKITTDFGGINGFEIANGVALQADGKILVAGYSWQAGTSFDFALARYNADGSLDSTFDGDGKVTTDFAGRNDIAYGVALQADGKIVLAGESTHGVTSYADFALARYNTDGSLDTSFDSDGKVTTDFGNSDDSANGVALQTDGKIVLAGYSLQAGTGDFALARYTIDGSLDAGFDGDGKVTTDFGGALGYEIANGVALQSDGKIMVAGYSYQGGIGFDFALARYTIDGSLDAGFDGDGKVNTDFGGALGYEIANGLALQADGKIVVTGYSDALGGGAVHFALARYTADGALDPRFDGDGKVSTDFGGFPDVATGVALQADGKIVVAGYSNQGGTFTDFALARYIAVGSQDFVEAIIPDVQALVTEGALNNGQGTSLLVKLQAVIQLLDSGQEAAAGNLLLAFVTQLQAFVDNGTLTVVQGQPLIDAANAVIAQLSGSPLNAAGGQAVSTDSGALNESMLAPVVDQAIANWHVAGIGTERLDAARQIEFRVADIPGARLGVASADGIIWIDRDAAGWGWFVDPTPADSSEFPLPGDHGQQNRIDLLTVVMHELGHALGFEHDAGDDLMSETLSPGDRRWPEANVSAASLVGVFLPPSGTSTLQTPVVISLLPKDSNSPEPHAAAPALTRPVTPTASTQSALPSRSDIVPSSRIDDDDPFLTREPLWNLDDDLLQLLATK